MSSKMKLQRVCQYCSNEFTARTSVTKYCGDYCAKRAYKDRIRDAKMKTSDAETQTVLQRPLELIKAKEFLTVKEVASLLNCSIRSVYLHIGKKRIKAVNLSQRLTRIKRTDIDQLFA